MPHNIVNYNIPIPWTRIKYIYIYGNFTPRRTIAHRNNVLSMLSTALGVYIGACMIQDPMNMGL